MPHLNSLLPLFSASLLCGRLIPLFGMTLIVSLLAGCLATPVSESGGMGSVTVTNSNPSAIIAAAQSIFLNYGYTPAFGNDINSVSFNKNSNQIANVLWGSYGDPQTIRVKVMIIQIPGTNDYRISPK
ncbi:MAG: hypothetical protein WCO97_07010, partial [bacterium]